MEFDVLADLYVSDRAWKPKEVFYTIFVDQGSHRPFPFTGESNLDNLLKISDLVRHR